MCKQEGSLSIEYYSISPLHFASLKVSVEARANLVRSDLKKRAEDLDARHPGLLLKNSRPTENNLS